MPTTPFASGKNHKLVFILNDDKVTLFPRTWNVKENATISADPVNGEDRDRLQKVVNFYEMSVNAYVDTFKPLDALIANSKHLDLLTGAQPAGIAMMIYPNDGTKALYQGRELSIDDWEYNPGERATRAMMTIPIRFRYFDKAA